MIRIFMVMAALAASGDSGTLFKCTAPDQPVFYTTSPKDGMTCRAISYATRPSADLLQGAATILPQCTDPRAAGDNRLIGPSPRARECTRIYCGTDSSLAATRAYALGQKQTAEQQQLAATCIARKEQDLRPNSGP